MELDQLPTRAAQAALVGTAARRPGDALTLYPEAVGRGQPVAASMTASRYVMRAAVAPDVSEVLERFAANPIL